MRVQRDILTIVSDSHIGSTVGLCCPQVELDDGGTYYASKAQRWLYDNWNDFWTLSRSFKPTGGGARYAIVNGDSRDRPHHATTQLITHNTETIGRVALEIFDEGMRRERFRFFTRGTAAHVGDAGKEEEGLARELDCIKDPDTNSYSWWVLPLEIQGILFTISHHGSSGGREWTRANNANVLAAETELYYAEHGERCPNYIIRSHTHRFSDSGLNYRTRAIFTPAWQLCTSYSHAKFTDKIADIGGLVFVIENGVVQVVAKRYYAPRRSPWSTESLKA